MREPLKDLKNVKRYQTDIDVETGVKPPPDPNEKINPEDKEDAFFEDGKIKKQIKRELK